MQAETAGDLRDITDAYLQILAHKPEAPGVIIREGLAGELQPLGFVQRFFVLPCLHTLPLMIDSVYSSL